MKYRDSIEDTYRDCDDFDKRTISVPGAETVIYFIKGMSSRDYIASKLVRPITERGEAMRSFDGNFSLLLRSASVSAPASEKEAADSLLRGNALVLVRSEKGFFAALSNAQTGVGRDISEPMSDVTVKGAKAGFVEDAETNMTVLRQYIRSPSLKFRKFTVGDVSRTKVMLAYFDGRADMELVGSISERLSSLSAGAIVDSGNISMLLSGKKYTLLPDTGSTEKVDKAASKLMSGRIGIIVDGSPFVLTLPYVFAESLQASDDYLHTPWYATFIRALRFISFVIAIFAPACFVGFAEYMPNAVGSIVENARNDIPFSLFLEMFCVLLLFELLREVGVRMPRTVGDAVGIVGSIILGDAAVEAGFVSSVSVIIAALAALCAFMVPAYMYVTVLARFAALIMSELLGIWGLALTICVFIAALASKTSFGAHYLFPLSPFDRKGMEDFIFTDPKQTLGRNEKLGR